MGGWKESLLIRKDDEGGEGEWWGGENGSGFQKKGGPGWGGGPTEKNRNLNTKAPNGKKNFRTLKGACAKKAEPCHKKSLKRNRARGDEEGK